MQDSQYCEVMKTGETVDCLSYPEVESFFIYVLCHFSTWAVMTLHKFLSFVAIKNICYFILPPSLYLAIEASQVAYSLFHSLPLLPLNMPCECIK